MRRAARLETLGILHHDHLPLPYSGAAPFPDHADRGPRPTREARDRPPRTAVDEWRPTSQLRESHKFIIRCW
jgi:hypothetical protein